MNLIAPLLHAFIKWHCVVMLCALPVDCINPFTGESIQQKLPEADLINFVIDDTQDGIPETVEDPDSEPEIDESPPTSS